MRKRFLLYPLLLLTLSLFVPWASAAGVEISNWNDDSANHTFSCDLNLSGADMTGQIFAVLFAESGQMKSVTAYSAAETVHIDLSNTDTTDYIRVLWTDTRYAPVAETIMRMRDNGKKAYEDFEEEMRKARQNDDVLQSGNTTLLVSSSQALPWKEKYGAKTVIAGPNNFYVLKFSDETTAQACKKELEALPCVRYVEFDDVIKLDMDDADPELLSGEETTPPYSWGVEETGIDKYAADLKKRGFDKQEVIVAVVDSGVDDTHPFLQGRLSPGYDFVEGDNKPQDEHDQSHGTHMAGIVADCTTGMNVKIMPLRVIQVNNTKNSYICEAIYYAIEHGAKIINLSLKLPKHDQLLDDAIEYAISKKVTVVICAGNQNTDALKDEICPAHVKGCITVAAMGEGTNKRLDISNYGKAVDISAPGEHVKSCVRGGEYKMLSGTSQAAPHVAAAAALLMCEGKTEQSPDQIRNALKDAAATIPEDTTDGAWKIYKRDNSDAKWTDFLGAGFLNMRPFIKRTVTFRANGGTGSMNTQTVSHGTAIVLPDCKFTRTNYNFKNWNTQADGKGTAYAAGASLTVTADLTLYAQWTEIPKPVSTEYLSWGVTATHMDEYVASLQKRGINKEVIVAVVGTGVDSSHPFLSGRLVAGYDFVDNDDTPQDEREHSTHVAGIIADCTRGTNVKIMPVRVLDKYGYATPAIIAFGIRYAAEHGVDVICLPLGYNEDKPIIDEAIQDALSSGITVVVAACNRNDDASNSCPAHIEDCITVAAVDENLNRCTFSNYGTVVDIAAPGGKINSSIPGNKYQTLSGTSMATPHVAAAAALLIADKGPLTPQQVSDMLKAAAQPVSVEEPDKPIGAGVLDMRAFLDVYAMLYGDGEMVFQYGDTPRSGRTLAASYPVPVKAGGAQYTAWYEKRADIKTVTFADTVIPDSTALWFFGCTNLTKVQNLINLDTSQTTDMSQMFARCGSLKTLDLSTFNTGNVVNMRQMFNNCSGLETLNLSGWDTANVTNMTDMFNGCSALKTVYVSDSFTTGNVSNSTGMFKNCTALPNYDSARTDKTYARIDGGTSAPGYFTRKG